jgi:predicted enzyme related to lactoylglutathione lyase
MDMPQVPKGSGEHPIPLIVIAANDLAASSGFYAKLFGWQLSPISAEMAAGLAPAGPTISLRANVPQGFQGMIPYIGVRDVEATLARVVAGGAKIERAAWSIPGVGKLARFKDAGGTIYGLTDAMAPTPMPHMAMPVGSNPKPPAGAICHLEMFAKDGDAASRFFGDLFGWGSLATMPQYMAFDPGAGVSGIFQSHTPSMPAVAYIYTSNVAAKLAEIEAAGGKPSGEPMGVPGFACFGYFKDPSGADMGLIGV